MRIVWSDDMLKLARVLGVEAVRATYEVSTGSPLHPDPTVASRMREFALSDCGYGCKVYADPRSKVLVLAHNSAYGCPK